MPSFGNFAVEINDLLRIYGNLAEPSSKKLISFLFEQLSYFLSFLEN